MPGMTLPAVVHRCKLRRAGCASARPHGLHYPRKCAALPPRQASFSARTRSRISAHQPLRHPLHCSQSLAALRAPHRLPHYLRPPRKGTPRSWQGHQLAAIPPRLLHPPPHPSRTGCHPVLERLSTDLVLLVHPLQALLKRICHSALGQLDRPDQVQARV